MHVIDHPQYRDDELVGKMTEFAAERGHTVLQLFQFPGGEKHHSELLLSMTDPKLDANCLSLGCGIGGMEAYWSQQRPDLKWTLVNTSASQLEMCKVAGTKVKADIEGYWPPVPEQFDFIVIAYVLGHVNWKKVLKNAFSYMRTGGKIMVYDIFDATPAFRERMLYDPPSIAQMPRPTWGVIGPSWMPPQIKDYFDVKGLEDKCTPALMVYE